MINFSIFFPFLDDNREDSKDHDQHHCRLDQKWMHKWVLTQNARPRGALPIAQLIHKISPPKTHAVCRISQWRWKEWRREVKKRKKGSGKEIPLDT